MASLDEEGLGYFWGKIKDMIGKKVDKVEGKGLSTNDYTTAEKNKLADIKNFTGANSVNDGSAGLVPAPDKSEWINFLCADGTWKKLTLSYDEVNQLLDLNVGNGYSRVPIPTVTANVPGLMTPAMFNKFDNLIENTQTDISGNAGTATKLKTARTIDGVNFDGAANITHYAVCYTAASTAAKTVSLSNFKLVTGARVIVRFWYENSAVNPTLNVNSTGAKPICYKNSNIPSWLIPQYAVLELVYSGSYWYVVGTIDERKLLSTTSVIPTALTTWAYTTAISGLAVCDEIQVWVEIGDGFRGWVTLSRNDPHVACITGYVSPAYYGCAWVQWDKSNNRIGVYARTVAGWTVGNISVSMITGVKLR